MTTAGRRSKIGLSPGTVLYTGTKKDLPVTASLFSAERREFIELDIKNLQESLDKYQKPVWININGLHDIEVIKQVGEYFSLHSLVLEDIVSPHQRPKIEEYPSYMYIVVKMLNYRESTNTVLTEQVSIILGKDYVLSFQEEPGDVFDSVRNRLRSGKIIHRGMTYLAYALIDSIVDYYFLILEELSEDLEELEENLITDPQINDMHSIHNLKREVIYLRKSIWPLREIVKNLQQKSDLLDNEVNVYFRDVYDHIIQVMDHIETFREMLSSMLDIYLTSASNRMNEIMKVLTFIATIFIPLSFIVGVYGMNFKYMPELDWKWGYFAVWGCMIAVVSTMLWFFKKKKWI